MKKLFLALAAMAFLFTSCLENEIVATTSLEGVEASATVITPSDDAQSVAITATVLELAHDPISTVVIEWNRGGVAGAPITMTPGASVAGNGFSTLTYTGTISEQDQGTVVTWRVVVTKANGETIVSAERTVTWLATVVLAAWNYEREPDVDSRRPDWPATSGTLIAGTNLEFFYANNVQGNPGTSAGNASRAAINIANNAAGWFPGTQAEPGIINAETSAGWVITLSTIGYEDITFSAYQASSNRGPADFRLAYRIGTTGAWTEFPGQGIVSVQGDDGSMGPTFAQTPLPEAVNNQAEVQIKVWIGSLVNRNTTDDPLRDLEIAGGNTSINNIVFMGLAL